MGPALAPGHYWAQQLLRSRSRNLAMFRESLLIVGGDDEPVVELNREAMRQMTAQVGLEIVPEERSGGSPVNQPPVNPARRRPATMYGQFRMSRQIKPE